MQTLRQARRAAKLTQTQLAKLAGVRQDAISRLEKGVVTHPSHKFVMRICRVLKVDPAGIKEFADNGGRL